MKKLFDFSSKNGDKKFLIVFTQTICAIIILISLVINLLNYVSSVSKTEETTCKIINAEKITDCNYKSYDDFCYEYEYYLYTYSYEVNDKEYTIETKESLSSDKCLVYYNKLNPKSSSFEKIKIKDAFMNVIYTLLLCEFVSCLIVFIYIIKNRKVEIIND